MKLILVESPTKAKTIANYIDDSVVIATKGHMFDLKKASWDTKYLGIDTNKWEPENILLSDKKEIFKSIQKYVNNKKCELIFATDNDREGESISYYIATHLNINLSNKNRAVFHEINKKSFTESLKHMQSINVDIVNSQKTRRMIDRIIGIKLSKFLRDVLKMPSASAGRVQSVALQIICTRQKEIDNFEPKNFYRIYSFDNDNNKYEYSYDNDDNCFYDLNVAENIKKNVINSKFKLDLTKKVTTKGKLILPYITSSLLRDSFSIYGFSNNRTMRIAQELYEGNKFKIPNLTGGLITYIRTDSYDISKDFQVELINYLKTIDGEIIRPAMTFNKNKIAAFSQNAHECIRQSYCEYTPGDVKKYLSSDQFKIYEMIYNRTLQSLCKPPILETTKYFYKNSDNNVFTIATKKYSYIGYLRFSIKNWKDNEINKNYRIHDKLFSFKNIEVESLKTKPKPYYNEGSIIKSLETLGIGRPSTYSTIIPILKKRNYINIVNKQIHSTKRGLSTSKIITDYFNNLINIKFTAEMETKLDDISKGKLDYHEVTKKYFSDVINQYKTAENEKIDHNKFIIYANKKCPKCKGDLIIKYNRFKKTDFLGCINYSNKKIACNYTSPIQNTKNNFESKKTTILCDKCNNVMVTRKSNRFKNIFIACSNFPKCKNIYQDQIKTKEIVKKLYTK